VRVGTGLDVSEIVDVVGKGVFVRCTGVEKKDAKIEVCQYRIVSVWRNLARIANAAML